MRDLQQDQHVRLVQRAHLQGWRRTAATTRPDRDAGLEKAQEWGDRIPIGIIYEDPERPTYEEQVPQLSGGALAKMSVMQDRKLLESIKNEFM